ncbi:FaeA/PapI family transcriptional regulator [Escherichia coli]|uniref:FaeA/PapI family transcriptional regulator n=1 Tax=Escherichia coli TaxID=562 RepID=UPI000B7CD0D6|nr:FaeA/PapI family transcriptional regulator [Escherichia coli]
MKKEQILDFIHEIKTPCRTTDIATHFKMSVYQARHYLMCLEKEKKIRRTPLHRGARTLWEVVRKTKHHE